MAKILPLVNAYGIRHFHYDANEFCIGTFGTNKLSFYFQDPQQNPPKSFPDILKQEVFSQLKALRTESQQTGLSSHAFDPPLDPVKCCKPTSLTFLKARIEKP